jgi:hypothetical protein
MQYTSAAESPDVFHFWTGVSTLAGALRRRVWRDELIFQWTPNFYLILVAPAGVVAKSTSIDLGMDLLRSVEGIHFGPESLTWQALGESLASSMEYIKYQNGGEEELIPMSAVTIPVSELGTFLTTDDSKFLSFLTSMWDSRRHPFKHKTRTQELIDIKAPWLNIIGATTPTWIQNNIPESMIGEGLLSRVLFIFGDKKRHLIAHPSKRIRTSEYYNLRENLVADLQHIATSMVGSYEMTPAADRWSETWYARHNTTRPLHMASDRYGGYHARKQGHMFKIAMILAAAKRDALVIEAEDLEEADRWLLFTEHSMIRVFEAIGVVDEAKHVAELIAFVRAYGWISAQDLHRCCHNIMSRRDFEDALRNAVQGQAIKLESREGVRGLSMIEPTRH